MSVPVGDSKKVEEKSYLPKMVKYNSISPNTQGHIELFTYSLQEVIWLLKVGQGVRTWAWVPAPAI